MGFVFPHHVPAGVDLKLESDDRAPPSSTGFVSELCVSAWNGECSCQSPSSLSLDATRTGGIRRSRRGEVVKKMPGSLANLFSMRKPLFTSNIGFSVGFASSTKITSTRRPRTKKHTKRRQRFVGRERGTSTQKNEATKHQGIRGSAKKKKREDIKATTLRRVHVSEKNEATKHQRTMRLGVCTMQLALLYRRLEVLKTASAFWNTGRFGKRVFRWTCPS